MFTVNVGLLQIFLEDDGLIQVPRGELGWANYQKLFVVSNHHVRYFTKLLAIRLSRWLPDAEVVPGIIMISKSGIAVWETSSKEVQ